MSQNEPPNYDERIKYLYETSSTTSYTDVDAYKWSDNTTYPDPSTTGGGPWTNPYQHVQITDSPVPVIPAELMVCVVCGVEDVLIFCDACKDVIREARKKWAKDFLEEIENALS